MEPITFYTDMRPDQFGPMMRPMYCEQEGTVRGSVGDFVVKVTYEVIGRIGILPLDSEAKDGGVTSEFRFPDDVKPGDTFINGSGEEETVEDVHHCGLFREVRYPIRMESGNTFTTEGVYDHTGECGSKRNIIRKA